MGCVHLHFHSLYDPPTRLLKPIYIVKLFLHLNRYPSVDDCNVKNQTSSKCRGTKSKSNKLGYIVFGKS